MLLRPRVGKPPADKLALKSGGEVVISDERLAELARSYAGSCAPCLTVARLRAFVAEIEAEADAAGSEAALGAAV